MDKDNNKINNDPKIIKIDNLLKAGCNFGQKVRFGNAKMKKYIFSEKVVTTNRDGRIYKNKINFFDIKQIETQLNNAYNFLIEISKNENNAILFVGTSDSVKDIIIEQAERAHSFYVNSRWLGGTLTNFKTIRKRISYMQSIERMEVNNVMESMPKKEVLLLRKKYYKLKNLLYGIRALKIMPSCLIVGDVFKDRIAIKEANKLKIPVIAVANSNADPRGIDYIIPGNDMGRKSLKLFLTILTDAIMVSRFKQEPECAFKDEIEWINKKENFGDKFVAKTKDLSDKFNIERPELNNLKSKKDEEKIDTKDKKVLIEKKEEENIEMKDKKDLIEKKDEENEKNNSN